MQPKFIIYCDDAPAVAPPHVEFVRQTEDHQALFDALRSHVSTVTTVCFCGSSALPTRLQSLFAEQSALLSVPRTPFLSLYELEGQTVLDLLGRDDAFESHFARPVFCTVRLSSRRDARAVFRLSRLLSQNFN